MIRKLYLEPTSRCNLNCVMCFHNAWIDEKTGHMSMDTFQKVMEDERALQQTETIFFGGMGEPLFHPGIVSMVSAAKKTGKRVEILTNGTLLSREMSAALLDAELDRLWISIDGFDREAYESIRMGGKFDRICRNLETFNQLRDCSCGSQGETKHLIPGYVECIFPGEKTELGITFVVMKENLHQLEQMIPFAKEYCADEVKVSNVIPGSPEMSEQMLYSRLMKRPGKRNLSEQWGLQINRLRVSLPLMDLQEQGVLGTLADLVRWDGDFTIGGYPLDKKLLDCPFINDDAVFVRWDGDVSPCMGLLHSSDVYTFGSKRRVWHQSYGNLQQESLWEIWNKKEYAAFRHRVKEFGFSPCLECDGCNLREENQKDCFANEAPTCGGCVWAGGLVSCP